MRENFILDYQVVQDLIQHFYFLFKMYFLLKSFKLNLFHSGHFFLEKGIDAFIITSVDYQILMNMYDDVQM